MGGKARPELVGWAGRTQQNEVKTGLLRLTHSTELVLKLHGYLLEYTVT